MSASPPISKKSVWSRRLGCYAGTIVTQMGFGLATTYIGLSMLSAADYGIYAIVSVITALFASLAAGPAGVISAGSYLSCATNQKAAANATFALITTLIAIVEAVALFYLWPLVNVLTENHVGSMERYFSCLSIIPQSLVVLYTGLNHNQGFSGRVLAGTLSQGIITLIAIYSSLYVFSYGPASLYIAQFGGFFAGACTCVIVAGRMRSPTWEWAARWRAANKSYSINTFIINLPPFVENVVIARFSGLAGLAVWQHSRIYNAFIMRAGKVIGLTILPVALSEAKEGKFAVTQIAWRVIYIGFTLVGIIAAFFAEPLIDFLTHGKLLAASMLVPWWAIYNLLQSTGREAEATLFSADLGTQVINAQSIAKIIALILLVPLIYLFGMAGAIAAYLLEVIWFRFLLRKAAKRVRNIPTIDNWTFGGSAIIIFAIAMEHFVTPIHLETRLLMAGIGIVIVLFLARKALTDIFSLIKPRFLSNLTL